MGGVLPVEIIHTVSEILDGNRLTAPGTDILTHNFPADQVLIIQDWGHHIPNWKRNLVTTKGTLRG